jgi:hypothetical protein
MQRFWTHKNCMVIAPPAPNAFCWTWMWSIGRWSSWSNTARAGHRRRQHPPEVGAVRPAPPGRPAARARRRVPGEHRQAGRGSLGPVADAPLTMLGCIVAGDAVKRRVEEQMELWDVPARGWWPATARPGCSQRLRPPLPAGRRPLGRDDRCAAPHAGAGASPADRRGDGGYRRDRRGDRRRPAAFWAG